MYKPGPPGPATPARHREDRSGRESARRCRSGGGSEVPKPHPELCVRRGHPPTHLAARSARRTPGRAGAQVGRTGLRHSLLHTHLYQHTQPPVSHDACLTCVQGHRNPCGACSSEQRPRHEQARAKCQRQRAQSRPAGRGQGSQTRAQHGDARGPSPPTLQSIWQLPLERQDCKSCIEVTRHVSDAKPKTCARAKGTRRLPRQPRSLRSQSAAAS